MNRSVVIARVRGLCIGGLMLSLLGTAAGAALDEKLLHGLKARAIGPASISGRVAAIDALAANPNRIFVGAASGGVWESNNGGLTWAPLFDDQPVASIGALAINQANPDLIWVGTGEGAVRNSTSIGGGIFKSVDGGRSWERMGLERTERINRIALHPGDPDIVYVAALGTLWGDNEERGVYKTVDGGRSWTRILHVDQRTGATDVKLDPVNPNKLYAALWEHRRWPYHFKSGGPGSGMYLSYDGGATWKRKTEEDGLPKGELGRMVLAPSPADPKRVYALVEAKKSAVIRSDDGGETWRVVNTDYNIADRPFYYTELAADPENPDRVYNISTRLRVSIDGGKTFEFNPVIDCCAASNTLHIDNHSLWINPADPRHLIIGNDGGLGITRDRGETWRFVGNLPLAQFYHVAVDDDHPYHVYGGLQDNGSMRGPAELWENGGIRNLHWQEVGFGDGFDTVPDPRNSRQGYSMSQGGYLYRWNLDNGELRLIRPPPPDAGVELRFNWNAGFAIDPFDPDTIYYGSQFLHRSEDRGLSWRVISGDLTSNDPSVQTYRDSGGLTPDVTAAENYTTIVSVAPSPLERGTIWVGSDDGRIHVTRNGGADWTRVDERVRGVPAGAWVPMIDPSPHDPGVAHVVFDDHRRSNMNIYVFRAEAYGQRWKNLGHKRLSGYALSVRQDPVDPELLFLGTEFGLYFSTDGGTEWSKFSAGVPTVSVMDMAIQTRETDLVLGTHGRAAFVIDDYRALRGLTPEDFGTRLKILSASDGQQYDPVQTPSTRFTGSGEFRADNEPYGVMITFMAAGDDLPHPDPELERARKIARRDQAPAAGEGDEGTEGNGKPPKLELTVRDAEGQLIRTLKHPLHQGLNRIVWGLERDGVRPMPGPDAPEIEDGLPGGPEVPPGSYTITLQYEDVTQSQTVSVLADPRASFTAAEREENYRARVALLDLREAAVSAVERIVSAHEDLETIQALIDKRRDADNETLSALEDQAEDIGGRLDALEKRFRVPPKTKGIVYDDDKVTTRIALANYYLGSSFGAPSPSAQPYVEAARVALDAARSELDAFAAGPLAEFRSAVEAAGIGLLAERAAE